MRKNGRSPAPQKPAAAAAGAPHVRKFMLKLFDREDGKSDYLAHAAHFPYAHYQLQKDSYRPVKTTVGCNLSKGRALMAAATRLTSTTITTPSKGVNHIMRNGYSALDTI